MSHDKFTILVRKAKSVWNCICHYKYKSSFSAVAPKFESIMEDVDVQVGQTTCLAVVVEGKPDPDILWFKVFSSREC